jgi:SAM-dependent methyltransferase
MADIYDYPEYYEIAFSFRDIKAEVDLFEQCFKRFSKIRVKSVLELGCGTCPHIEELHKRGYQYNGLDLNQTMLKYARKKAKSLSAKANFFHKDMINFSLDKKFDFVYVLLGALEVKNILDLVYHFCAVAKVLRKGGLYFLDWCVQFPPFDSEESWVIKKEGIDVKTTFSLRPLDRVAQLFEETIKFEVNDHGRKINMVNKEIKRLVYPQEFLMFVCSLKDFEFLGWWNNWNLKKPLENAANKINRPIVLLRRR